MKEVELPSGAILVVRLAPFADGRALYQAFASEMIGLKIQGQTELDYNFFKDVMLTALASPRIEKALWACMPRSTIGGSKITESVFEDELARQDYIPASIEVALANVLPFTKALSARLQPLMQMIRSTQAPTSAKTT